MQAICNSLGACSVVWREIHLRAERITWFPEPADALAVLEYLDRNGDKRLSSEEYLATGENDQVSRRDFLLFDTDSDGYLTIEEFTPIANGVDSNFRGPMSDPIERIVDRHIARLDQELSHWDKNPAEERDFKLYERTISSLFSSQIPSELLANADRDRNGRVSRTESRQFLEAQLGIRTPEGDLLRTPNGNINNLSFFIHIDANGDNQLEGRGIPFSWRPGNQE